MATIQTLHLSIFRRQRNGNLSKTPAPARTSRGKRTRAKGSYSSTLRHHNLHRFHYMQISATHDESSDEAKSSIGGVSPEALQILPFSNLCKKSQEPHLGDAESYNSTKSLDIFVSCTKIGNDNSSCKRGSKPRRLAKRGPERARNFRRLGFGYLTSSMSFIWRKAKEFFDGGFAAHESNRGNEFVAVDPYFSMPVLPPLTSAAPCVV